MPHTPTHNTDKEAPIVNSNIESPKDSLREKFYDFTHAKGRLSSLKDSWNKEQNSTESRRKIRNVDISPRDLRNSGKLLPDETMIPMRIVDTNIKREQPQYINYLKGSNRLAIFVDKYNPTNDTQELERAFSEGLMYPGWEIPHYSVIDGMQMHGWDSLEVVMDVDKPLHVNFEHVGHENLFFSYGALDIQACDTIIRLYEFTSFQLRSAVKDFDFNSAQVDMLLKQEVSKEYSTDNDNYKIYKVMFKYDGIVNVAWFSFDSTDWLKSPSPLYLGRKKLVETVQETTTVTPDPLTGIPVPSTQSQTIQTWIDDYETDYPIFLLRYAVGESKAITSTKGRVFYDEYKQEAQTAIASGYVNGLVRAANIYGSVGGVDPGNTAAPKQIETKLEHGGIYDKPVNFWSTNYPDPGVLSAMQWFDVYNSQEVGQVNFAVTNRKDSRKTATENQLANQQAAQLSSAQVATYSMFLRMAYSYVWSLVQSRAMADLILLAPVEVTNGLTTELVNNHEIIKRRYEIKAAGDIDIIQRNELLMRMRQDWPVIANTSLATQFLKELLRISYPTYAAKWTAILDQGDAKKQVIMQLSSLVQSLITPEQLATLAPAEQQQLQALQQQVQQVLQAP